MSAAERTKDRSNLLQHWEGRVLGLSSATSRKVLSDRPALKPDWGKPTVRNFRGEDGNGSYRAILLPERKAETPKRPSLSLRLRAPYLYPDRADSAKASPSAIGGLQSTSAMPRSRPRSRGDAICRSGPSRLMQCRKEGLFVISSARASREEAIWIHCGQTLP